MLSHVWGSQLQDTYSAVFNDGNLGPHSSALYSSLLNDYSKYTIALFMLTPFLKDMVDGQEHRRSRACFGNSSSDSTPGASL